MITALIEAHARTMPDSIALAAPGREPLTYARLAWRMKSITGQLNHMGIGPGDRVVIVLPNGLEMALAFLTVASCATAAPLNPAYRTAEFEFYLSDLRPKAVIVPPDQNSPARSVADALKLPVWELASTGNGSDLALVPANGTAIPPVCAGIADAPDTALLLHTSGTTSRPKLVPLTRENLLASARGIASSLDLRPEDRCLNVMPLFHIHGLVGALLSSLSAGASVVCPPGFHARYFFDWLDEFCPTWYTAVPTMHQALLSEFTADPKVMSRRPLRFIRSCSAALSPRLMADLESLFDAPVIQAYGMTEASHQIATNPLPPRARKAESVGLPAGVAVAILDDRGNPLSAGARGEVAIRGYSVTAGYANNPSANEAAVVNGWFRTGDHGYLDEDGYLFLTGRIKEIINRGGEKISPREVDDVLLQHPAVEQAVTFAVPHRTLGQDVAAAVVLRPNTAATESQLRAFAADKLAEFKVPRQILCVKELPKSATGKPLRIGLSEKFGLSGQTGGQRPRSAPEFAAPSSPLEITLAKIWCELLRMDQIGTADDFFQLGGDSLLAAQVVTRVSDVFSVQAAEINLFKTPTIAALAKQIKSNGHSRH